MSKSIFISTILFLFLSVIGYGQKKPGFIPPSIDDEDIPVAKTELPLPEEGKDYVVKYFKGTTDGVESRIAVKNLGYIIRPAMVQVISEDGRELAIELVKKNWDDVVRSGKTKDGKFQNSFKTAMEFGIKINAMEMGIPFIVAVSAGVELFPASNLFVDANTMRSSAGNKEVTATDEVNLKGQESGQSNSILFIIIAIALVGILALLAVMVFKRKGKGAATILFLLMISWPTYANVVTAVGQSAVGVMAGGIGEALADHYGNGGFKGDDPLSEDDQIHDPEPDPRGQPSLPSSCYEITRMGRSGSSGGDAGKGFTGAKNPDNAGGDNNMTMSTGGGNNDNEVERIQINNDYLERLSQIYEEHQAKMERAANNYAMGAQKALEEFDRKFAEDSENVELALQLQQELEEKNTRLANEYEERTSSIENEKESALRTAEQNRDNRLAALEEEKNSKKDPNSGPKKDPDRQRDKGNPGDGDQTKGGPNSPTAPGDSNNPNRERDRETEAGCKCLEAAYAKLQEQRNKLEKILIIGQHTKKVTDFGISFGDDFSGVHGVSGLVWQTQRVKVLESIDKFDISYNDKYKELIDKLYNALIEIDECEKKLGYENWYSHSGFIYYEFMKVRYASYK